MFQITGFKQLQFFDQDKTIGNVYFNPDFSFKGKLGRPFFRNKAMVLKKDGRVNYALLDEFVVQSLTDLYQKINNIKDADAKTAQINNYQRLYVLWQKVMQAKQMGDPNLNNYYDDIVYQLYLMGYRN